MIDEEITIKLGNYKDFSKSVRFKKVDTDKIFVRFRDMGKDTENVLVSLKDLESVVKRLKEIEVFEV